MRIGRFKTAVRAWSLMLALLLLVLSFQSFGVREAAADTRQTQNGTTDYYLVGSMNSWEVSSAYKLARNDAQQYVEEYWITLNLSANDEVKITNADKTYWYPDGGSESNRKIDADGNYTIYFQPGTPGGNTPHLFIQNNSVPVYAVGIHTDGNGTAIAGPTSASAGTPVTVTVTPNAGYSLDAVTGAPDSWHYDAYTGVGTFTMPAQDVTLNVTFKQNTVTALATGSGTVSVDHTAAAPDTQIAVTATPESGHQLRRLTVDGKEVTSQAVVTSGSYSFSMPDHNVTVEAVFEPQVDGKHFVYVFTDGLGTAFADKTVAADGETVTITTENTVGYTFSSLSIVGATLSGNTFPMGDSDVYVTAHFTEQKYSITLHGGIQGTARTSPNGTAYAGTSVQIIVNANEGYTPTVTVRQGTDNESGAVVSGTLSGPNDRTYIYTFTMPTGAVTAWVTYEKPLENGYYLIGKNGWTPGNEIKDIDPFDRFTDDPLHAGQMILSVDLTGSYDQSIKIVKVENGAITVWYPNGSNYSIDSAHACPCVIYFYPDGHIDSSWHENSFFVQPMIYYLADATSGIKRDDDRMVLNPAFKVETKIGTETVNLLTTYGVDHEHMVLTWLNDGDTIKVVKVDPGTGAIVQWYPSGTNNEYPTQINIDSTQAKAHLGETNGANVYGKFTGLVFVFFEEQLGSNSTHPNRGDWTNWIFDVQKAYTAEAADKVSLNAESLTYNLTHGSMTLSVGTPFTRTVGGQAYDTICELAIPDNDIYCSIHPETGYMLDGTPYITYNGNTVSMTKVGDRYSFRMPLADVVIHAPMKKVFGSQSVLLSGQLGVNFFVDLGDVSATALNDYTMQFQIGSAAAGTPVHYNPNYHSTTNPNYVCFTCYLNAIQMADTITATLKHNDDTIAEKTYSLQQYVSYFDRTDSTQASNNLALQVIRATMDFGYYAQKYNFLYDSSYASQYAPVAHPYATVFDYNGILEAIQTHALSYEENGVTVNKSLPASISKVGLQLAVDSATSLLVNLYTDTAPEITVAEGKMLTTANNTVEHNGWTWKLIAQTGYYQVRIEGISAHDLDKQFTIRGTVGGDAFTIKASAFSYAYSAMTWNDDSVSAEIKTAAKQFGAALYRFYQTEVAYRAATHQDD